MEFSNKIKGYKKAKGVLEDYLKVEEEKTAIQQEIEKGVQRIMHSFGLVGYDIWFMPEQIKISVTQSKPSKLNGNIIRVLDDYLGAYGVITPNDFQSVYILYDKDCVSLDQTTF